MLFEAPLALVDEALEPEDELFAPDGLLADDFERVEPGFALAVRFFVPVVLALEALLLVVLALLPDVLEPARFELVFLGELFRGEVLAVDVLPEVALEDEDLVVDDFEAPDFVLLPVRVLDAAVLFDLVPLLVDPLPREDDDLVAEDEPEPLLALLLVGVERVRFRAVERPVVPLLLDELLEAGVASGTVSAAS